MSRRRPGTAPIPPEHVELARAIVEAHAERRVLASPFRGRPLPDEAAYAVQSLVSQSRWDRGEAPRGWKLGYTSAVMREQMGISSPNMGPLTDRMLLASGDDIPDTVTQPRVEPEVALIVGADVTDAGQVARIQDVVVEARAALEVVDSVWRDYRFTWAENTADGSSAAYVVLGPPIIPARVGSVRVTLAVNEVDVAAGSATAAMGSPVQALAWLASRLLERGQHLRPGDVVITGGLTMAAPLARGDLVAADFEGVTVGTRWPSAGDDPHDGGSVRS